MSQPAAAVATLVAVVVLWWSRDVMTVDVVVRLILPGLWLGLWTLATLGAGRPFVSMTIGRTATKPIPLVVIVAVGAGVLSLTATVLALTHLLLKPVLIGILITASISGIDALIRSRKTIEFLPPGLASPLGGFLLLPAAAAALLLTSPPAMYDVLHYHMAFPEQWLLAGGFVEFVRESFSYYFSAHGILFTYCLATVGPWGASALGWWMAVVALVSAATLGSRLGGPRTAPWAAACYALTPAALETMGYGNVDHAVAAWGGAALVALTGETDRKPTIERIAVTGFLAGTAAAAKYLALATVLIPVFAATTAFLARSGERGKRHALTFLIALGIAAAIPLAPWVARNIAWTGNPVYPYATGYFGGPPTGLNIEKEIALNIDLPKSPLLRTATKIGALPFRTVHPRREGGLLGPQWLFLLLGAALVGGTDRRLRSPLWAATIVGLFCWGFFVQYGRFLLPVLVPAAALAGTVPPAFGSRVGRVTRSAFIGLLVTVFAWNSTILLSRFDLDRLATVAGLLHENDFRSRWIDVAPATDFAAEHLPDDAVVLLVAESRSFGIHRKVVVEDPYRTPLLVELAERSSSPEDLARRIRDLGVTHLLINEGEMARMAGMRGVDDYWFPASAKERRMIVSLFEDFMQPLFKHDKLMVGRLRLSPQPSDGNPVRPFE